MDLEAQRIAVRACRFHHHTRRQLGLMKLLDDPKERERLPRVLEPDQLQNITGGVCDGGHHLRLRDVDRNDATHRHQLHQHDHVEPLDIDRTICTLLTHPGRPPDRRVSHPSEASRTFSAASPVGGHSATADSPWLAARGDQ